MPGLDALIERHHRAAGEFTAGDLIMPPRFGVIILTCVDPRVAPSYILSVEPGDAFVLRNVGGRVTSEIENDLAMIWFLMQQAVGTSNPELELAIIHHTDCGMERMADPHIRSQIVDAHGLEPHGVEQRAIFDQETSFHDDIRRLAESTKIPKELKVSGFLYDVHTGVLRRITESLTLAGMRD